MIEDKNYWYDSTTSNEFHLLSPSEFNGGVGTLDYIPEVQIDFSKYPVTTKYVMWAMTTKDYEDITGGDDSGNTFNIVRGAITGIFLNDFDYDLMNLVVRYISRYQISQKVLGVIYHEGKYQFIWDLQASTVLSDLTGKGTKDWKLWEDTDYTEYPELRGSISYPFEFDDAMVYRVGDLVDLIDTRSFTRSLIPHYVGFVADDLLASSIGVLVEKHGKKVDVTGQGFIYPDIVGEAVSESADLYDYEISAFLKNYTADQKAEIGGSFAKGEIILLELHSKDQVPNLGKLYSYVNTNGLKIVKPQEVVRLAVVPYRDRKFVTILFKPEDFVPKSKKLWDMFSPSVDTNIPQTGVGVKTARVKSVPRLCYQLTEESLERVWGILNEERPAKVDFNNLTITTNKYGGDVVFTLGSWATTVRDQDADYWPIQGDIFQETYEPIDANQDLWQKKIIDVSYIQIDTVDEATVNLANSFMGTSLTVEECISNGGIPVQSLEGLQNAVAGNVILKGVKGEVWTTGISNFEKVYERLD